MSQNAELELAWNFVEKTNRNIFLTGKAGTGKTTFLHKIRNESFKRLVVVAPTGVAAINAKGVTIHSFFQMSFGPILPPEADQSAPTKYRQNNTKFQKKFNKKKIDIIRSLDLLIIDEVSMVRADLLDGIDQVLRRYKDKSKVFGGVQLLMIGDLQQLAPVVKNEEWQLLSPYYNTPFFFGSKAYQESAAIGLELKHIYRQSNQHFIGILNEIRNNQLSEVSMNALNERYDPDFRPKADDGFITLTTHNDRANKMNREELSSISRKSHFFRADIDRDFPEHSYPTHERLELKVGAQVMFIKNDSSPEKRYYNGKIGKIVQIDKHEVVVRCPGDVHDITTEREVWENLKYSIDEKTKEISESVKGSFSQMPLRLAWAITIHKSQGLTFEKAIIDAASSFAHGQTYVALSRCKTLEGIVLKTKINRNGIIQDNRVIGFTKDVEEKVPNESQLQNSKNSYQLDLIADLFNFQQLPYLVNRCQKVAYQSGNTLKGNFNEPLKIIKEKGVNELMKVANSFKKQLAAMNTTSSDPENNEEIQERIKKGIAYFIPQTEQFLLKPLSEITYTTDNKAIKKDFKEPMQKMSELFNAKLFCLRGMADGFNTMKYLELRAKAVLQDVKPDKKAAEVVTETKHPILFSHLRKLRHDIATEEDLIHYQIFTQKSLYEMCEILPTTNKQLKAVAGMGKVRIQKYGDAIIEIIREYCENNELNQPEETIKIEEKPEKKQVVKGDSQRISLSLFKSGKSIKEIAEERSLVISTVESHLSTFIKTGEITLEEIMGKKKAVVLRKLVKSIKYENLNDLKSQLSDKFGFSELRMVLMDIQKE